MIAGTRLVSRKGLFLSRRTKVEIVEFVFESHALTENRSPLKTNFLKRDDTFGITYDGPYGEPTEESSMKPQYTAHERSMPEKGNRTRRVECDGDSPGTALSREDEDTGAARRRPKRARSFRATPVPSRGRVE
ncbi:Uncharacterized protein DBV15_10243 [Temnothorax longispinosus]|uniref:Uncharacterized protein n=1 Tax=Temnothorax longispinosus TaxID=300112 RepID=A0A4S2JL99_9HYME|nr:Uncharacterized protein DBV15_10243 [Temnothorax longispinosus]